MTLKKEDQELNVWNNNEKMRSDIVALCDLFELEKQKKIYKKWEDHIDHDCDLILFSHPEILSWDADIFDNINAWKHVAADSKLLPISIWAEIQLPGLNDIRTTFCDFCDELFGCLGLFGVARCEDMEV